MEPATGRNAFRETAREAPPAARVPVEVRVTVDDPFSAYRRARTGPGGVFLETTGGQSGWGYFATEPERRVQVGADAVVVDESGERGPGGRDDVATAAERSPTLSTLADLLEGETLARGGCDVPYPCGWIGWLSYDVAREVESLPETTEDDRELPRFQAGLYDRVAAWEEPRGEETPLRITACPRLPSDDGTGVDETDLDALYDRALARAEDLARRALDGDGDDERAPVSTERVGFESDCGQAAFEERVRTVKAHVRDGDTFQANVSQRLSAPAAVHPVAAYAALRRVNPAPYSGLLESPGVDLERNDLGKVCEYGSVDVSEYRRVDRYAEVMHLVSLVDGIRREEASLVDAVAATFPGGTITGAPKPRTMEIIDEVESSRRGPYTGSIGVFGFDDRATLNILIRTLVRTGEEYHLRVGAGIVHDSVPEREWEETLAKGQALVDALDEALAETTMRVSTAADGDGSGEER